MRLMHIVSTGGEGTNEQNEISIDDLTRRPSDVDPIGASSTRESSIVRAPLLRDHVRSRVLENLTVDELLTADCLRSTS